ncbi:MAG TPA: serine/threonine-protein kinase [Myxococcales bacterium]|nr:serine/threonine-protein kinase [Myxococcales bacterium]
MTERDRGANDAKWSDEPTDKRPSLAEPKPVSLGPAQRFQEDTAISRLGPGTVVGGYRILESLGEGGMGRVFTAQQQRLGKRVALKVLRPEYASSPSAIKRFFQEAKAASCIENPHIVQVFDFGDDQGLKCCYLVMELLNGSDLARARDRDGPFPLSRSLSIIRQLGAGLAAAHARGIVHRDLKPENVFLVPDAGSDFVKILDFGLAKLSESHFGQVSLSQQGVILGTPEYMSPEQAAGAPVDARSDVYSLATLFYWMVAGVLPLKAETVQQLLIQRATEPASPLPRIASSGETISPALREAVRRALERDPAKRTGGVREFVQSLEEALIPGSSAGRVSGRSARVWKLVPVVAVTAVLAAGLAWRAMHRLPVATPIAVVPPSLTAVAPAPPAVPPPHVSPQLPPVPPPHAPAAAPAATVVRPPPPVPTHRLHRRAADRRRSDSDDAILPVE